MELHINLQAKELSLEQIFQRICIKTCSIFSTQRTVESIAVRCDNFKFSISSSNLTYKIETLATSKL